MTDFVPGGSGSRRSDDPHLEPLSVVLARSIAEPQAGDDQAGENESSDAAGAVAAHLATEDELSDWDRAAVRSPNGHVQQSRAWAEATVAQGGKAWHIAFDDGFRLLVVARRGNGAESVAYASRGPVPERDPGATVQRAVTAADVLEGEGIDALVVDGETPASSGLPELLADAGFERTDEQQPSGNRMDVRLGPDDAPNSDEKTIFASFGATTRNLIRQADRYGLRVRRLDAGGGRSDDDWYAGSLEDFDPVELDDAAAADSLLETFGTMLAAAHGQRTAGASAARLDWWRRAITAGHMLYLQAEHPEDGPIAGAAFYRHGHRLTYALAAEDADRRRAYPGAGRLLIWRGIQVALDERRSSVDLGGVDTAAFRNQPSKGDPTYTAYQLRESFGARWVELTGAHRRSMHPTRARAGRFLGRITGLRR